MAVELKRKKIATILQFKAHSESNESVVNNV